VVEQAARRFMSTWLSGRTAASEQEWLAALAPLVDPAALEPVFAGTSLAALPDAIVTDLAVDGPVLYEADAVATLSDGTAVLAHLVWSGSAWLVVDLVPVGAAAA
jgi:hypothetical protein